jgi:hypothetical protein
MRPFPMELLRLTEIRARWSEQQGHKENTTS